MGEKCHPLDTCISLSSRDETKKCTVLYPPKSDLSVMKFSVDNQDQVQVISDLFNL